MKLLIFLHAKVYKLFTNHVSLLKSWQLKCYEFLKKIFSYAFHEFTPAYFVHSISKYLYIFVIYVGNKGDFFLDN